MIRNLISAMLDWTERSENPDRAFLGVFIVMPLVVAAFACYFVLHLVGVVQ